MSYKCGSCGKEADEKETCCETEMKEKESEVGSEMASEADVEVNAEEAEPTL